MGSHAQHNKKSKYKQKKMQLSIGSILTWWLFLVNGFGQWIFGTSPEVDSGATVADSAVLDPDVTVAIIGGGISG